MFSTCTVIRGQRWTAEMITDFRRHQQKQPSRTALTTSRIGREHFHLSPSLSCSLRLHRASNPKPSDDSGSDFHLVKKHEKRVNIDLIVWPHRCCNQVKPDRKCSSELLGSRDYNPYLAVRADAGVGFIRLTQASEDWAFKKKKSSWLLWLIRW